MEFILVEAGTFMMGVSDVDYEEYLKDKGSDFLILAVFETSGVDYEEFLKDNDSDYESIYARAKEILPYAEAKPAHKVILTQSYYIGKYPVTQIQWERIMGNNPSEYKDRPNCPVETVSWNDCQKFISKLNQKSGKKYRLPTEAEWEFAARGGNKSRGYKFSGSDNIDEVAWCEDNSFEIKKVEKKSLWGLVKTYEDEMVFEGTRPVGTKKPNELGIYDMSGNVSEWCLDKIHEYCSDYQTNPLGTNDNDDCHVMRGGNWRWSSDDCLVSYRSYDNRAFSLIGFRLVLPVE
jgi:formylglycine-generating enzyme required for sulfatase activity